jgi:hypothetical protein
MNASEQSLRANSTMPASLRPSGSCSTTSKSSPKRLTAQRLRMFRSCVLPVGRKIRLPRPSISQHCSPSLIVSLMRSVFLPKTIFRGGS